jgi:hypothetical protein
VTLRRVTVACGLLGVGLMLPFDATLTLALGVAFMLAFIVCGVFLIAEPGFLEGTNENDSR